MPDTETLSLRRVAQASEDLVKDLRPFLNTHRSEETKELDHKLSKLEAILESVK